MYWMKNQSRQENLIYLVVWSLLFATPLLSLYLRTQSDEYLTFHWHEVFFIWGRLSIFLLLFVAHNFLLAPLIIHHYRRTLYFSLTTALLAGFMICQYSFRPKGMRHMDNRPPRMELHDRHMPRFDREPHDFEPDFDRRGPHPEGMRHHEPLLIGERHILSGVLMLLMFGANLGIKLYFRTRKDRRKLEELEKQNLEQQLEYLKYQINPHFFMNTLNNIHALVDINPQKAQDTILELSKMMRFVLYEGDKSGVPLTKEFEFIRNYTRLMQLRYTDKVRISIDVPAEAPDKTIPPLMLISFIENAFKHGVSYQHDSFIDIRIAIAHDHLYFDCQNSKAEKTHEEKPRTSDGTTEVKSEGGVGLVNVRKRLDLLYDKRYTLDMKDEPDIYTVKLILPL